MSIKTTTAEAPTLLQINSSLNGTAGESTRLVDAYAKQWLAQQAGGTVVVRDLSITPVPHLDAARFSAFTTPPDQRNGEQQAVAAYSDALIAELSSADEIVLGLPMYNLGVPSTLKAWFDHVARAGETFRYTETGPQGLLNNVRVTIMAARGGQYTGTPKDSQTQHVTDFFSLLGITDLKFVYAEGLSMGPDVKAAALAAANSQIEEQFQQLLRQSAA